MNPPTSPSAVKKRIDRDHYVPFHLNSCANKMSRGASRVYLRTFGIGVIEWAMLSFLSIEPNSTANQICEGMSLDKAAASRNLKTLLAGGDVTIEPDPTDSRKRVINLTPKGAALHDAVMEIALRREEQLLAGFSTVEREALLGFLRRMGENLVAIGDGADDAPGGRAARRRKPTTPG